MLINLSLRFFRSAVSNPGSWCTFFILLFILILTLAHGNFSLLMWEIIMTQNYLLMGDNAPGMACPVQIILCKQQFFFSKVICNSTTNPLKFVLSKPIQRKLNFFFLTEYILTLEIPFNWKFFFIFLILLSLFFFFLSFSYSSQLNSNQLHQTNFYKSN